jgi:hypothetical protein
VVALTPFLARARIRLMDGEGWAMVVCLNGSRDICAEPLWSEYRKNFTI